MKVKIILLLMLASAIRVMASQNYAEEWIDQYVTPGSLSELKKDALTYVRWFDTYLAEEPSKINKLWHSAKTMWASPKASLKAAWGGKQIEQARYAEFIGPVLWGTADKTQWSYKARRRENWDAARAARPEGQKNSKKAYIEYWQKLKHATCKYLKGLQLNAEELEEFKTVCKGEE
jgi:hypothetical protein